MPNIFVYGDMFAANVKAQIPGALGTTNFALNASDVLAMLQSETVSLAGARVILSTGIISTFDLQQILSDSAILDSDTTNLLRDQIRYLRVRWVTLPQIRVLSIGKPRIDAQLAMFYTTINVSMVPIPPAWIGPDNLTPVAYWSQIAAMAKA